MKNENIFYKDIEKKIIKENLFSSVAEYYVKNKFLQYQKDKEGNIKKDKWGNPVKKKSVPTTTQIRKFYNYILGINHIIEFGKDKEAQYLIFKEQLPYIKMLKAKVAYSEIRKNVNKEFKKFIDVCIDEIKTLEDFKIFCTFFESIVAFSRVYLGN